MALPRFGGKPKTLPDFRRVFKAILGTCIPAIEMVRIRNAMPGAASRFIMGVTDPTEAWNMLDRQYGNRDMTIALTITGLLTLKILMGPGHKQVEILLQGMCSAQACLRAVQAEKQMLTGLGTIGRLVSKMADV